MSAEILNEVRGVAADLFEVDPAILNAATSPNQVEKWDSVQHLNLVLALEGKYGIQFDPDEMEQMTSLGNIASMVGNKIA